ncbi:MAG: DUF1708 domain-containing protein, partial [Terriglobus roseus]|nr:DUF1708 domain-containing protein [Terriglobus roseus]
MPLGVETTAPTATEATARKQIIFDFFDLLAAVAARGKANGLGGRKLSRMAGWWAFEHSDQGNGFDGGYKSWQTAADAASHLFFAYLRSLSPESTGGVQGISQLPRSLQSILAQTDYPPERPVLMHSTTSKVVMIVDSVSPTPFALLRRAKHFEYRDDDEGLQGFSAYDDPVKALTDECRRVLNAISHTNQSSVMENGTGGTKTDPSWSAFEDFGFSGLDAPGSNEAAGANGRGETKPIGPPQSGLRTNGTTRNNDFGRPTTPSWADFLSTGFADERNPAVSTPMLLPPDKVLPPIGEARGHSSQSHLRPSNAEANLEPGELASITSFDLDETFWWVWMTSLASEESAERKAAFGRCALIETNISGARWLVMEEQVKGASPGPEEGAYIAEKKSRFSFTRRGRLTRRKSTGKKPTQPAKEPYNRSTQSTPLGRTTIGAEQQKKIQAAALALKNQQNQPRSETRAQNRLDEGTKSKTNSTLTLQPQILSEAAPALQWAKAFDRDAIRSRYLNDSTAGTGRSVENLGLLSASSTKLASAPEPPSPAQDKAERDLPALPREEPAEEVFATPMEIPVEPTLPVTPPPPPKNTHDDTLAALVGDEKPDSRDHPALRQGSASHVPQEEAASSSAAEPDTETPSPESGKGGSSPPNKLRKEKPGGLKKFFTKRGRGNRESKAITPQPAAPQEPSPVESTPPEPPAKPSYEPEPEPVHEPEPEPVAQQYQQPDPEPAISRIATNEEREANQEFSRFDQGPLDDIPAFVPSESPAPSDSAPAPPEFKGPAASSSLKPADGASPIPPASPVAPSIDVEEAIPEAGEAEASSQQDPSFDRWAQIRKNAQDRARRTSEEQSGSGPTPGNRSHSQS